MVMFLNAQIDYKCKVQCVSVNFVISMFTRKKWASETITKRTAVLFQNV